MKLEDYTEAEIESVVKAFKAYMKKMIIHLSFNYAKKLKKRKYLIVELNENTTKQVSLSINDEDIFFCAENMFSQKLCELTENKKLKKALSLLKEREEKILYFYITGYSVEEISEITKLSQTNIRKIKSRAVKKIIKELEK